MKQVPWNDPPPGLLAPAPRPTPDAPGPEEPPTGPSAPAGPLPGWPVADAAAGDEPEEAPGEAPGGDGARPAAAGSGARPDRGARAALPASSPFSLERMLLVALLGAIALGCAVVLWPFLSAVLWAAILVFTTWPVFLWLRRRLRLSRSVAALLMVVLTAVVTVLPLTLLVPNGAQDVAALQASVAALLGGLPSAPHWLYRVPVLGRTLTDYWNAWAADLGQAVAFFRPYFGIIAENGLALLLGLADGVVRFLLALFIAFFFWMSGGALGGALRRVLRRIAGPRADALISLTGRTVRGTVYGVLGTALVQGVLTAFGFWLVGIPRAVLWGALAALLAVLPIGAPLVWIPAGLWLLLDGATARGVFLLAYGTVAVSGADHLIRPFFISRGAQLPFLLTVLGVLGGVLSFGVLGIFVGPVLLGVGYTLVLEFARSGGEGAR